MIQRFKVRDRAVITACRQTLYAKVLIRFNVLYNSDQIHVLLSKFILLSQRVRAVSNKNNAI